MMEKILNQKMYSLQEECETWGTNYLRLMSVNYFKWNQHLKTMKYIRLAFMGLINFIYQVNK